MIKEHLLFCNHSPDFEDFSVLTATKYEVTLMETLLMNRDQPFLKNNKQSLPLELLIGKEQSFIKL